MTYLDFNCTQCPIHFGFGALYQYEKIPAVRQSLILRRTQTVKIYQ